MTRVSEMVVIDGIAKTRLQWCKVVGISSSVVSQRMRRDGLTLAEAIRLGKGKGNAKERRRAAFDAIPLPQEPLRMVPFAPEYYVTPDGRIWSGITKKWLHMAPHAPNRNHPERTYARVWMGKYDKRYVHFVVASAWIENPEQHPQVLFLDDNSMNFHKDNLAWANTSEACKYRRKVRRDALADALGKAGEH